MGKNLLNSGFEDFLNGSGVWIVVGVLAATFVVSIVFLILNILKDKKAAKEAAEKETVQANEEEPKQEETVTPSEEPRDEDYWNPTFTDEQAQETWSRLPKANSRYEEEEDQEEVIDDDMPSDKEVASVVGGYDEENDEIF